MREIKFRGMLRSGIVFGFILGIILLLVGSLAARTQPIAGVTVMCNGLVLMVVAGMLREVKK